MVAECLFVRAAGRPVRRNPFRKRGGTHERAGSRRRSHDRNGGGGRPVALRIEAGRSRPAASRSVEGQSLGFGTSCAEPSGGRRKNLGETAPLKAAENGGPVREATFVRRRTARSPPLLRDRGRTETAPPAGIG